MDVMNITCGMVVLEVILSLSKALHDFRQLF